MVNAARGEVELKLGDKTFILCAEMARVAAWTADVDIHGLIELQRRLSMADPKVLNSGARHLCISKNAGELVTTLHFKDFPVLQAALVKALTFGLDAGNPQSAEEVVTTH